jgi:hypothetical protein
MLGCGTTLLRAKFISDPPKEDIKTESQNDSLMFKNSTDMDVDNQPLEEAKQEDYEDDFEAEEKSKEVKFDKSNPESTKLEILSVRKITFTWISKILCYSFKNKCLMVHDLMKGISLLNNVNDTFQFTHESISLIDQSIILISHAVSNSLVLAQDDTGMLYLVGAKKKKVGTQKIWTVAKKAQYFLNERITSILTLSKGENKNSDIVLSTSEGNIYTVKILEKEMVSFMTKIQYNVLKQLATNLDENEKLLKKYERGFDGGFNGNLISKFFDIDLKKIKQLLNDIKQDSQKDNDRKLTEFNLLSIKMLFF